LVEKIGDALQDWAKKLASKLSHVAKIGTIRKANWIDLLKMAQKAYELDIKYKRLEATECLL